jgi:biopolymer transport protein ExbB/TolQ
MGVSITSINLWLLQDQTANWDLISMLRSMSWLAQAVVILLLFMLARSLGIMVDRTVRYTAAWNQSRHFVQQVAGALREGSVDEAISIAERNKKSHIAEAVTSGLVAFQSSPPSTSDAVMIEASKRGLQRSKNTMHVEMKRGLSSLANIASTAPLVGLFGTVVGIVNAFRSAAMEKHALLAAEAAGISEALVTTALGLLVAVPAVWSYNYFITRMEGFDLEMENSAMQLVNYLIIRLRQRKRSQH